MNIEKLKKMILPETISSSLGNVFYAQSFEGVLTLEKLRSMKEHETIATGRLLDNHKGVNLASTGRVVRWVASRGVVDDWCIYAQNPHYGQLRYSFVKVARLGDKIISEHNIKKIIPCDDDAFSRYRM